MKGRPRRTSGGVSDVQRDRLKPRCRFFGWVTSWTCRHRSYACMADGVWRIDGLNTLGPDRVDERCEGSRDVGKSPIRSEPPVHAGDAQLHRLLRVVVVSRR